MGDSIIFILPGKAQFTWEQEAYHGISDGEINALKIECAYAMESLQDELSKRDISTHKDPPRVRSILDDCYMTLQQNSRRIKEYGLHSKDLDHLVDESMGPSIEALKQGPSLRPKSRIGYTQDCYDELLWLISRMLGPALALLVMCSVGRWKVTKLNASGRARLVQYVRRNSHLLFCPAFQQKSIDYGLPCHIISRSQSSIANAEPAPFHEQCIPISNSIAERNSQGDIENPNASINQPTEIANQIGKANSLDSLVRNGEDLSRIDSSNHQSPKDQPPFKRPKLSAHQAEASILQQPDHQNLQFCLPPIRTALASQYLPHSPQTLQDVFDKEIASTNMPCASGQKFPRPSNISDCIINKSIGSTSGFTSELSVVGKESWLDEKWRIRTVPSKTSSTNPENICAAPAVPNLLANDASNLDSSVSQTSSELAQRLGGASDMPNSGNAKYNARSQAKDACQVPGSEKNIAIMAEVNKLESIPGAYLFNGTDASHMRHREKGRQWIRFTDTVRLYVACREGEDYKLVVWLSSSPGKAISQAMIRSAEDLRNILGDYLFEAWEASNWPEKRTGQYGNT